MWRHIASNALTFLVVLTFLLGGMILWGQSSYTAEGPLEEQICLRVERGSNMRAVSEDLLAEGAVTSGALFRIGTEYADKAQDLKAGSWLLPQGASMGEITEIITRGGASTCGTEVVYRIGVTRSEVQVRELDPATNRYVEMAAFVPGEEDPAPEFEAVRDLNDTRFRVTIAEGATSWQIVDAMNAVDVLEGEVATLPPEGSLAPDSYEVREGDTRQSLIDRMQAAQAVIIAEAWQNRAEDLPLQSAEEMLILASIIEKETAVADERRQVSSVFINRLNQGMRLQTDPTVIYGVTEGKAPLGRGLRQSELRAETPWNTYVISGLPPTPIANPGRASIAAAVDPDGSDYIFFVADGTGGHAFARTLAEHNANVAVWRQIEAERAEQGN
ncbi:endolytic transglycosylase MltG [Roseovarius sp. LXJ103]|uniref:endolytic transglycosylase MltG n=1 Tax=Roseovarius carneus TaxID=2853164 RepID=UPI000D6042D8|nr:endolytic transglycosylase MltG [Roseovarius carneus]MBZ8118800.1 endolytic transglycosylase MltG [Roseovarius carneus]PWE35528.1 endolytic transglycosylase MltG [Pelagicola sp. LXJ1103]